MKKFHWVIKFNQKACLKRYIDMNTKLRRKGKTNLKKNIIFSKTFSSWWIMQFFEKLENFRKHRNIKLVTTERKNIYLVSEPNYHTTKFFTKNVLAIEMSKTQTLMNKPVYLGLSILDVSKILMWNNLFRKKKLLHPKEFIKNNKLILESQ